MAKVPRCGDLMQGCSCTAIVEGKYAAEMMEETQEHGKTAHGVDER